MIRNLLPVAPKLAIAEIGVSAYQQHGGLLIAPTSWRSREVVAQAPVWAMDNSAFTAFDADKFRRQLDAMQGLPNCLFAVVPDVVQDHNRTLERYHAWHAEIRDRGYPRAFVLQNGVTLDTVPFADCEVIFIGGSTHFKYTALVREIAAAATQRGKWVHNGRVNSGRRIRYSLSIGCNSFDGTTYAICPGDIIRHIPYQTNKQGLLL